MEILNSLQQLQVILAMRKYQLSDLSCFCVERLPALIEVRDKEEIFPQRKFSFNFLCSMDSLYIHCNLGPQNYHLKMRIAHSDKFKLVIMSHSFAMSAILDLLNILV